MGFRYFFYLKLFIWNADNADATKARMFADLASGMCIFVYEGKCFILFSSRVHVLFQPEGFIVEKFP